MDSEPSKQPGAELTQLATAETASLTDSDSRNFPAIFARIKSEESGTQLNLGELWRYRELLYFLTLRDIKVRYKQTLMGVAWVIIQPLMTMLIFTLVFNRFVRLNSGPLPYPLFALSGLLLWIFFANAVTNSTHSLVSNSNLITKVYFPRLFIPAASVGAGLVDLSVAFLLLLGMCFYYGIALSLNILLLPLFVLLMALLALAVGLLAAALTVKYRDLRHALPFIIQLWMFASPVIYPTSVVPEKWKWLVTINPVAGAIEGFRASLTGTPLSLTHVAISVGITLLLLGLSIYVFRRLEDSFADVI
ncbi:MAG TPA: ABC transporter permease [Pyrinomonadaceae bacterium]|nr:ABC transporter permease [Pyrinomonadaceae bacterium]